MALLERAGMRREAYFVESMRIQLRRVGDVIYAVPERDYGGELRRLACRRAYAETSQ